MITAAGDKYVSLWALLASLAICTCANAESHNAAGFELNDAVTRTLQMQPSIQLQKESVDQAQGALRSASGDFDWRLENTFAYSQDIAPVASSFALKESEAYLAGFKLGKQFRSGLYVEPNIQYNQSIAAQKTEYLQGRPDAPPQNTARINFLVRVPLLQGLGEKNVAFREIAAARELEAARFNLLHRTSQSVLDTVLAYLDYLGAHQRYEVYKESEQRAKLILEKTQALAQADELPAAEVLNVSANLADKQSMAISAEQSVIEAKTRLGQAIGIPYDQIEALSAPADTFPPVDTLKHLQETSDKSALRTTALRNRMDLQALRKQVEGIEAQVVAARDQLKPVVNLELNLGYDGYKSGSRLKSSLQSLEDRQSTPDWNVGVRFVYPLGNNTGRGNFEQARSRLNQGKIQTADLERMIQSGITMLVTTLASSSAELVKAYEAVSYYEVAVSNEKEKYLMGESTLLDLLYIQDRLDSALLNRISALQRAAANNARLRFELGTLMSFNDGEGNVDVAGLVQPGAAGK